MAPCHAKNIFHCFNWTQSADALAYHKKMRMKVRSASFGLCKHKPCEVELIAQNCDYTLTTHTAAMESNANQQLAKKSDLLDGAINGHSHWPTHFL